MNGRKLNARSAENLFHSAIGSMIDAAMLIITIHVNAPAGQAVGVKEDLAQYLERFGDSKVVSVVEELPEQLRMDEGGSYGKRNVPRMRR